MIFGKHVNKFYIRYWWLFLLGIVGLIAVDYLNTAPQQYIQQVIDTLDQSGFVPSEELSHCVMMILYIALAVWGLRVLWRITLLSASLRIQRDLRQEMFEKAERLSATYYHNNNVGTIMAWFTTDIETLGDFFSWGTVQLIDAIFLTAFVVYRMVKVDIALTLVAMIPILLIAIWGMLVEKWESIKWRERQEAFDHLYDFSQENFTGIRVIKAFVKENKEMRAFAKIAKENHDANMSFARLSIGFQVAIEVIILIIMVCICGFGGYFVYFYATGNPVNIFNHEVKISIGQLVAFLSYFDTLIWPMIALGQIITMYSRSKTSLKRISNFLGAPEDIKNPADAVVINNCKGEIEFKNFSFAFPNSDEPVLKNISLKINKGEKVGIVGKIGSGKTALVNILLRLYNIEENTVFIDGVDIMKADLTSLRNSIGYAPQDNFLFSDKVENNIAFTSKEIDKDKVIEAASFADVHENILGFKNGYETISGERGVTLSGGQKQRISLARAYYKNAPIMIMDDTVSAVDVKTEETILKNIKEKRDGLTTIVIASRVSTVSHFDKVLVLEDGRVESFDTPENLLKTSKAYQRMVYLQELEKEVEGGHK